MKTHSFISVDWGTSNFRLKLVETDSLQVLTEINTNQGIKVINQQFLAQKEVDRFTFFSNYLFEQLQQLSLDQILPIIISGMASANIGMHELDYAELPLGNNGKGLITKSFTLANQQEIILISGARSNTSMMRGEEIQAIGLAESLLDYGDGFLLLPGTHSKHIEFQNGIYCALRTFMTGEIFNLLINKSILENNLSPSGWNTERQQAFLRGCDLGMDGQLSENLFAIRANHLLNNTSKEDNYYFLSGLLIGDELSTLKSNRQAIFLAAPEKLGRLYHTALLHAFPGRPIITFNDAILENALLKGHKKILQLHEE